MLEKNTKRAKASQPGTALHARILRAINTTQLSATPHLQFSDVTADLQAQQGAGASEDDQNPWTTPIELQPSSGPGGDEADPGPTKVKEIAGIVYLLSPLNVEAEVACECSTGISLLPSARGKGVGSYAVRHVLNMAFGTLAFHRVSAHVLGPTAASDLAPAPQNSSEPKGKGKEGQNAAISSALATEKAMKFFVGLGFAVEGTRRRAVKTSSPTDAGEWRDVTSLSMLDTEWLYAMERVETRASIVSVSANSLALSSASESGVSTITEKSTRRKYKRRTRWDEMLSRHQREQESLASMEGRLRRSASIETIKPSATLPGISTTNQLDTARSKEAEAPRLSATPPLHIRKKRRSQLDTGSVSSRSSLSGSFELVSEPSMLSRRVEEDSLQHVDGGIPLAGAALAHHKVEDYREQLALEAFAPGPPPSDAGVQSESDLELESGSELGDSASVARNGFSDFEMEDAVDEECDNEDYASAVSETGTNSMANDVPSHMYDAGHIESRPPVASQENDSSAQESAIVSPPERFIAGGPQHAFPLTSTTEGSFSPSQPPEPVPSAQVQPHNNSISSAMIIDSEEERSGSEVGSRVFTTHSSQSAWDILSNPDSESPPSSIGSASSSSWSSWTESSV